VTNSADSILTPIHCYTTAPVFVQPDRYLVHSCSPRHLSLLQPTTHLLNMSYGSYLSITALAFGPIQHSKPSRITTYDSSMLLVARVDLLAILLRFTLSHTSTTLHTVRPPIPTNLLLFQMLFRTAPRYFYMFIQCCELLMLPSYCLRVDRQAGDLGLILS
jgi:hypothetical protein